MPAFTQTILPPTYYHAHFIEMTGLLRRVHGGALGDAEHAFLKDYEALDIGAQCLYLRMANRKTQVFARKSLRYDEVPDIQDALDQLCATQFAAPCAEADYELWLNSRSKEELRGLAQYAGLSDFRTGWPRARQVEWMQAALPFAAASELIDFSSHVLPLRREVLDFLLWLHFGRLDDGLLNFTLRDLGVRAVKARAQHSPRFDTVDEARRSFVLSRALTGLKAGQAVDIEALPAPTEDDGEAIHSLYDKVLFRAGQALEKRGEVDAALSLYGRARDFSSRERRVRLLMARGDTEAAQAQLDAMMAAPSHDEEYIFAADFLARKFGKRRTGVLTALLRDADTLHVDELYRSTPELAAAHHFERDGWQAVHIENGLWSALFGLLFWPELFESGGMSSDFDRLPHFLRDRSFKTRFAAEIADKLALVRKGAAGALIAEQMARHKSEDNGLFGWWDGMEGVLTAFLSHAPARSVATVIEAMCVDPLAFRDGFPDLLLMCAGEVRFVEIKAEGDVIRRNQLARLRLLREAGFDAEICRVAYRIDPDQVYVVVDVETTGGTVGNHRVTEIGAVKVQRGEVIDTFHTLINPQKHIPAFITQLTGIDDDMVRDAPVFADVADSFADFVKGSVFVAHNVGFDYGVLSSEYRRLAQRFHAPKLCTVASMRRYYPGHASYSLGRICADLNIPFERHHRAMDDAMATVQLLNRVNERRVSVSADDGQDLPGDVTRHLGRGQKDKGR